MTRAPTLVELGACSGSLFTLERAGVFAALAEAPATAAALADALDLDADAVDRAPSVLIGFGLVERYAMNAGGPSPPSRTTNVTRTIAFTNSRVHQRLIICRNRVGTPER